MALSDELKMKRLDYDAAEARRAPACSWRWNTGVRWASVGLCGVSG